MRKTAIISDCKRYRYKLGRTWDKYLPKVLFIGINPSTADSKDDDPTIRRLIGYAKAWGYGGFTIVNLFAYRSAKKEKIWVLGERGQDIVGPANYKWIKKYSKLKRKYPLVMAMWGSKVPANFLRQVVIVKKKFKKRELHCFQLTKDGSPAHPLFLPNGLKPQKFG